MEIFGHIAVFLLAGFQQYMWRFQGGRNSGFSALLAIVIAIGGVAFLGWWALLTMAIGMILGAAIPLSQ
jgi:hypothetical protein